MNSPEVASIFVGGAKLFAYVSQQLPVCATCASVVPMLPTAKRRVKRSLSFVLLRRDETVVCVRTHRRSASRRISPI